MMPCGNKSSNSSEARSRKEATTTCYDRRRPIFFLVGIAALSLSILCTYLAISQDLPQLFGLAAFAGIGVISAIIHLARRFGEE